MPGTPSCSTIASEAPKAAADDTPSVNGLARGLFRMVCISAPASPSAMPTRAAMRAEGRRMSHTMTRVVGSAEAGAVSVCQSSSHGRPEGPTVKSISSARKIAASSRAISPARRRRMCR
ncbi:hypothetical protein D9M69_687930 [compost metagenome]